jgi:hypothetical protein
MVFNWALIKCSGVVSEKTTGLLQLDEQASEDNPVTVNYVRRSDLINYSRAST